ncbi:MAG: hypothetical protein PUD59_00815 [bacterium]|nr:hypothetical protein [bacterium]
MKKILILLISLLFVLPVYAYQTNSYKIDIPNEFIQKKENYFIYEKDEKIVTILIDISNNNDNLDIDKYALGLLKDNNYIETIKNKFIEINDAQIDEYNIEVTKIDNHNALKIHLVSSNIPLEDYSSIVYQEQFVLSSKNYLYHLIVTSNDKEEPNSETIMNVIKSFKILDEDIIEKNIYTNFYLAIGIVIASWIFILTCILTKKNRKKLKNIKKRNR